MGIPFGRMKVTAFDPLIPAGQRGSGLSNR
jgi:hypothetical protein